ncbi:MAG: BlaI/MecI/CopY family transcriptional regulator [Bacteroidaceae bacterium]|nr:BlaI/MecI/CopY family transcriptional regulator [Bacteroidaceae bacterium]
MRSKEQPTDKYRELTKGELQIMNILWDKRHATVSEVLEAMPEPRPAYNTVLTFLRILTEKEYVGHEAKGRFYVYHPLVQKGEYTRAFLKEVKERLFDGSAKSLLSFFVAEENLSAGDVQELMGLLERLK